MLTILQPDTTDALPPEPVRKLNALLGGLRLVRSARIEPADPGRPPAARCTLCGISDRVPGIRIEPSGTCNHCRFFRLNRERVLAYFRPIDDLRARLGRYRRTGPADCLLLFSGGKDSTYTLYRLIEMGARVRTFTFDNGYISAGALANIGRVTAALGVDQVTVRPEGMAEVFRESLARRSSVCPGCFHGLLDSSLEYARREGIPAIISGLSRGQIAAERLSWFHRRHVFDPDEIDRQLSVGRQVYHQVERFGGLSALTPEASKSPEAVEMIDFFRYCDAGHDEILAYLKRRDEVWSQPKDCGFCSTNCLINDVGIHAHLVERGHHNYEVPGAWDVRFGHQTRDASVGELREVHRTPRVGRILESIGYETTASGGYVIRCELEVGATLEQVEWWVEEHHPQLLSVAPLALAAPPTAVPPSAVASPPVPPPALRRAAAEAGGDPSGLWLGLTFRPSRPLDPGRLRLAIWQVLLHHVGLRATIDRSDLRWHPSDTGGLRPPSLATGRWPAPEAGRAASLAFCFDRLRRGLDVEAGETVRFAHLRGDDDSPGVLVVVAHPWAIDEAGIRRLVDDLSRAYVAIERGEPASRGPRPWTAAGLPTAAATSEARWMQLPAEGQGASPADPEPGPLEGPFASVRLDIPDLPPGLDGATTVARLLGALNRAVVEGSGRSSALWEVFPPPEEPAGARPITESLACGIPVRIQAGPESDDRVDVVRRPDDWAGLTAEAAEYTRTRHGGAVPGQPWPPSPSLAFRWFRGAPGDVGLGLACDGRDDAGMRPGLLLDVAAEVRDDGTTAFVRAAAGRVPAAILIDRIAARVRDLSTGR